MGKSCSAANAAAAYVALVVGGGVLADWSEDATAEDLPNPLKNLSLDNRNGDSHSVES